MAASLNRRAFWLGVRDALPFMLIIVPFGMLFGVLAAEAGWSVAQVLGMSVLVIGGASQFTALQLLSDHAPLAIAIVTSLAVNLRFAMYSASLAPHFGGLGLWQRLAAAYCVVDQSYGVAIVRFGRPPAMSRGEKLGYFLGLGISTYAPWYVANWVGMVAGTAIPAGLALDFAVPVTFLALTGPAIRSLPHLAAAVVSVAVALALVRLPYNLWLIAASLAAMVTGALVESWQDRRRERRRERRQ